MSTPETIVGRWEIFLLFLDNLVLGLLIFVGFVDFDVFIDDH